jgi:hypothetical protein
LNKKLQKGLTTTMAAAMAMSVAIPATTALAAPATANGWSYSQGTWYYFSNGKKVTNSWKQDSSKQWFFLGANGAMVKNAWKQDSSKNWFFLGADGAMVANKWAQDSSKKWFYLGTDGAMVVNTVTPDGYTVGADGAWDGKPANTTPVTPVTLAVSSVSAIAANQIEVTFNSSVTDTSKIATAVTSSSGATVATTATWNADNTQAVLTTSYNLTEDTYSVNVKNDTTDLGTSSVAITAQKVAKIEITSTVLSVVPGVYSTSTPNAGKGFATYEVLDQYGNDITTQPLANNINWTVGIGTVDSALTRNGVLVIDPLTSVPLTTYASSGATINGYDTDDYVTTSANLTVSMSTGTVSDITLNKLTSPNNDDFNAGNTAGQWYLDYTALDASGNATTNYNLVSSGILQVNGGAFLTCAVVEDPTDSTKAAISVQVDPTYAATLATDTQIPITILTTNGKSSTLTVTLKKAAALSSFSMSAPTTMVASGETVDIPFTALDQNGKAITSFSSLNTLVNLTMTGGSTGDFKLIENGDGSATLQAKLPPVTTNNAMTVYLMANVIATGKTSQLTLNVQKQALASTLSLDNSVLVPIMQQGASQNIDFGYNYGGLSVKDQYDRAFDMTSAQSADPAQPNYEVIAVPSVTATNKVTVGGNNSDESTDAISASPAFAAGGHGISITSANVAGTQTVNFELVDTHQDTDYLVTGTSTVAPTTTHDGTADHPYTVIDQKSQTFSVVNNSDIAGYTASTLPTLYAQKVVATPKAVDAKYLQETVVYGTLTNGNKVLLAPSFNAGTATAPVIKNTIVDTTSSSSDFTLAPDTASSATLFDADGNPLAETTGVDVSGMKYDDPTNPAQSTSSANINIMVNGTDGTLHNVTVAAASSNATPVAKSISYYADTTVAGVSVSNGIVNVTGNGSVLNGKNFLYANSDGSRIGGPVTFRGNDQYGTHCAPVSVYVSSKSMTAGTFTVDPLTGIVTCSADAVGSVVLTGVTSNGLAQTITLNITH